MENRSPNLAFWDLYGHVCLFQIPGCVALQAQWPSRWAYTPWSLLPQDCCSYCPVHPDSPQDHHPVGILFLQSQLSYLEAFPDFWPHQIPLYGVAFLYSDSLWSSLYCGVSSLRVELYGWLVKVSWLGKLVLVFCWVDLDFFTLECKEISSNQL